MAEPLTTAEAPAPPAPEMWIHDAAPGIELVFRLPLAGWPRATFKSGFGYENARLIVDGARVLRTGTREELEAGAEGELRTGEAVAMRLTEGGLAIVAGGKRA